MELEKLLAVLPEYLQSDKYNFSNEAQAALNDILANPEKPENELREAFINWTKTYKDDRDKLLAFAKTQRGIGGSKAKPNTPSPSLRELIENISNKNTPPPSSHQQNPNQS